MPAARPVYEPRGREAWRDPFPMYAALREHDPVHHVPDNGEGEEYWVLSRFGDVFDAVVDARTFSSAQGLTFAYGEITSAQTIFAWEPTAKPGAKS